MIETSGMSDDDLARAQASDDNLAGIIEGRRRAARALLAPPGPAKAVRDGFRALTLAAQDRHTGEPGTTPGGPDPC